MGVTPLQKKPEASSLVAEHFSFSLEQVVGCCQMAVLYGLGYSGPASSTLATSEAESLLSSIHDATLDELGRYRDEDEGDDTYPSGSYALIAVTSDAQRAWEIALEKMGFTKQGPWSANTGSTLTHWALLPSN